MYGRNYLTLVPKANNISYNYTYIGADMSDSDMIKADRIVDRLYEEFALPFPIPDPREIIPLFGGVYEATSSYKINGDTAAVIKHGNGFTIAICEPGVPYGIDLYQKIEMDFLVYRTIGQLILYMGYLVRPKKWESYAQGIYRYKDIRFVKYRTQLEYFANAMMLPKRVYTNALVRHTKTGIPHGVDVDRMAEELGTTAGQVMERGKQLGLYIWDISGAKSPLFGEVY